LCVDRRHNDGAELPSQYGRQTECAALDGLLHRVRSGRSAVLVLRGEAGIGKTALLRYLTEQAAGFSVARCMGVESEMELAFSGLQDLCGPLLSHVDALLHLPAAFKTLAIGLKDRIEVLGGRMQVAGPLGGGTTLDITIPLRPDMR
jgi:AAA ATPase domain